MKTAFFLALITTSSFACQLKTPINLETLSLETQVEEFHTARTVPELETISPKPRDIFYPTTLSLSYTQDVVDNYEDGNFESRVIGARVNHGETVWGLGVSDYYTNMVVERSLVKTAEGEIHKVTHMNTYTSGEREIPFLADQSIVKIRNNKIVSIEISGGKTTYDGISVRRADGTVSLCVTHATR